MPYFDSLDIGNRALQHCGQGPILTVDEDSKANREVSFAYDKVRRAELQRNTWKFAIRKAVLRAIDTDTMILVPTAYDATKTYLFGSIAADTNGQLWVSTQFENINNTPGETDAWEMYFGPLTVHLYSSTTSYSAGELVYKAGATAGSYAVYMSLENANDDAPATATAYDAAVTYHRDTVVSSGGSQWRSRIEVNLGITPADGPAAWDSTVTYTIAQTVTGSDDFIYSSVGNGNTGHDPVTDGGVNWTNTNVANAWDRTPTIPVSASSWRVLDATIRHIILTYPLGSGPSSQEGTRNVFRLPAGFLKKAPQDPKAGSTSALGAAGGLAYSDWNIEGRYIVSSEVQPLVLRFVADVTQVSSFDDMFCEGFACSIATAICPALTQSDGKLQTIASEYKLRMGEARLVNAIETGPIEPEIDDYIACRQ